MTTKDRLKDELFLAFEGREEKRILIPAKLGTVINGNRVVAIPNRPGFVYVRLRGNYSEQIEAYNDSVNVIYDLPVLVEKDRFSKSIYRVVGRDVGLYAAAGWPGGAGLAPHGDQHSFGYSTGSGTDIVWVFKRQFMPLMVHPHPDPSKTLWIQAEEDWFSWGRDYIHFSGTTLDITGMIPTAGSNESRFVHFYVDADNQLKAVTGTTFTTFPWPDNQTLYGYIPQLTVDQGITLSAMILHSSTTKLEWNQFHDTRAMLNGGNVNTGNSIILIDVSEGILIEYPATLPGFQSAITASVAPDTILYPIATISGSVSLKKGTSLLGTSETESKFIGVVEVSDVTIDRMNFSTYTTGIASPFNDTAYPNIQVNTGTVWLTNCLMYSEGQILNVVPSNIQVYGTGTVLVRNSYLRSRSLINEPAVCLYVSTNAAYKIEAQYTTFSEYGDTSVTPSSNWKIINTGTVWNYANSWHNGYVYDQNTILFRDGDRSPINHTHSNFSGSVIFGTYPTSYAEINSSGTLFLGGNATVFTDLTFPAQATSLGGVHDPGFQQLKSNGTGSVGVYAYFFDKTVEEELFFTAQLPHTWKIGSDIHPHVHWCPTTSADAGTSVVWGLEYTWCNVNGTFIDTDVITATDASQGVAYKQQVVGLREISGAGHTLSSILLCRLFRMVSHPDDNFNSDAVLVSFDIHYEMDTLGSNEQFH